jgi:hypothetical protein
MVDLGADTVRFAALIEQMHSKTKRVREIRLEIMRHRLPSRSLTSSRSGSGASVKVTSQLSYNNVEVGIPAVFVYRCTV